MTIDRRINDSLNSTKMIYPIMRSKSIQPIVIAFNMILLTIVGSCNVEDVNDKILYGDDVTDIEGNVYHTVVIGSQVWMTENLKTTKYNDGESIPQIKEHELWADYLSPGYRLYNDDMSYKNQYGILYNWSVIKTSKLAPVGWRIPSDEDWAILQNYLASNGYNFDGVSESNKFAKSLASTTIWANSNIAGAIGNDLKKNNRSGFSALPGGIYTPGNNFHNGGYEGWWWTSSPNGSLAAWYRNLNYSKSDIYRGFFESTVGLSVRCILDK